MPPAALSLARDSLGAPGATAGYPGFRTLSWWLAGTGPLRLQCQAGAWASPPGTPGPRADLSPGECNSVHTEAPWFRGEQSHPVRWQKIDDRVSAVKGPEGTPVHQGLFRGQWTQACFRCGQVGVSWPLVKTETLGRKGGSPSLKCLTDGSPGNKRPRLPWALPRGGQKTPSHQCLRSVPRSEKEDSEGHGVSTRSTAEPGQASRTPRMCLLHSRRDPAARRGYASCRGPALEAGTETEVPARGPGCPHLLPRFKAHQSPGGSAHGTLPRPSCPLPGPPPSAPCLPALHPPASPPGSILSPSSLTQSTGLPSSYRNCSPKDDFQGVSVGGTRVGAGACWAPPPNPTGDACL